jgi:EAL domain-containing protein (putative c-di-GMP-specific phosphodiesterase class I)/ActR/RegA family two-component response regulator
MSRIPCAVASILIVDDSRVQRDHTAHLCRELGVAEITQASNGREALSLLSSGSFTPDLLIVDLEMPTMDGPELLLALHNAEIDIPIIVVSSRERVLIDSVQEMGGFLGLRVLRALQKPLQLNVLSDALNGAGDAAALRARDQTLAIDAKSLAAAIEDEKIIVHYQPKADLRTGLMRGAEALARWKHPELGFVPPDQFIQMAERHQLIYPLTLSVMNQAMLQAAAWQSRGLHFPLAINLSPLLLERVDLPQEIAAMAEGHGLPPDTIVFEITESSLVAQPGVALSVLARLRLKGFGLSIDDYGTGFSSMRQLARIPFTELKIDRSFVRGASQRDSLQVILHSAVDMANQLGLTSVAEGVETIEEWRLLQRYGCTLAQGWLIAKAMPGEEIGPWVKQHRTRLQELRADASDPALPTAASGGFVESR